MKKVLALMLAFAMVFSLAACGGSSTNQGGNEQPSNTSETSNQPANDPNSLAGDYSIKVWAAEANMDLMKRQIEAFNSSNDQGIKFTPTINPKSEADAGTDMITDIEAGPDLFWFAQDQFARLVQAGALAKLGAKASETVGAANDKGAVAAASVDGQLYAYPASADNGYFMYYDKRYIPDADVDSLEKLIKDCEDAKKFFAFETKTGGWYIASWFFGTGCKSEWKMDSDGKFIGVDDTFCSPNGLIAVKGMYKLVSSPFYVSSSSAAEFDQGAAVVVTGTWAAEDVKKILGDNMGITDLPSFNVDGKDYHLGSFNGYKLIGVKPQTDAKKAAVLHLLAQFLTDYDRQMERFKELAWGPANLQAQATEDVKKAPHLAALLKQNEYSVPQGQIHGSWWDTSKAIGEDVQNSDGSDAQLQAALDTYKSKIDGIFTMSDEVKNAFTVIGAVGGSMWDKDFPMTETAPGVWKSNDKFDLKAGDELKCRQGLSWDVSFGNGGDNFKVEKDGNYTIVLTLDGDTGNVSLE
jgi:arabinogalactan oligomer/maltooligosaccharide transport system substrate-binding protein